MSRVSRQGFGLKPEPWLLKPDLVPAQLSLRLIPCVLLGPGVSEGSSPHQGKVPGHLWGQCSAAVGTTEWFGLKGLKVIQLQAPSYGQKHLPLHLTILCNIFTNILGLS